MAITFNEVLKTKVCFDASGIKNEHDWLWDLNTSGLVYYPVRRATHLGIVSVQDLIDELMKVDDKQKSVFIFSDSDTFEIVDIDCSWSDRIEINVKRQQ